MIDFKIGVNEILVKEGFAQLDVDEGNDQLLQELQLEENQIDEEEEEWEEEAELLDRLHKDILNIDVKEVTEMDIELLSSRTERLEIKYKDK